MKKKLLLMAIITLLVVPLMVVNAASKTDSIVKGLKELVKDFDGKVTYEDNRIDIDWETTNSKSSEISYSYKDNIIEYDSGELTSYEDAEDAMAHSLYFSYIVETALKLNGCSEEELNEFYQENEDIALNFETNGIEIRNYGEEKSFESSDGTGTMTMSPIYLKIDVSRVTIGDKPIEPTKTTINSVIEDLNSDKEFTKVEEEGKVLEENELSIDDEYLYFYHTYYWDEYYYVSFNVENDILTYEDSNIETYEDAETATSHHLFAVQILALALKENGYPTELIQEFLSSEDFEVNYELNGFDIKELGENTEYTSYDGTSKLYVTPMSFKIDFKKANLYKLNKDNTIQYNVIEGANKSFTKDDNLVFRFDINYSKFLESGKVFIDGKEVAKENYTVTEGSTIITFNSKFLKGLSKEEHTIKATTSDGSAEANFSIIDNPYTGNYLMRFITIFGVIVLGLITIPVLKRKKLFNK